MIFCSRCDSIGRLLIYISKPFVISAGSTSYNNRERENKNIEQKKPLSNYEEMNEFEANFAN